MFAAVEVRGLREFRRELKTLDSKLPREVGQANKDAGDFIMGRSQVVAQALGGVHAHAAKRGMRSSRSQRGVKITLEGDRDPTILGAEFGSKRWRQFPQWRGNQWQPDVGGVGYFLHPTIRGTRGEFIDLYADAIGRIARKAFPSG